MPLDIQDHFRVLAAEKLPVSHGWDEGDEMAALGNETPALIKNLGGLSLRALLGLQAALGEWMACRFRRLQDDAEMTFVNEAVWAASIDYRYLSLDSMRFKDVEGPIDGPMRRSKVLSYHICDAYGTADFGIVRSVIASANLVKYVLPSSKEFQSWFKAVVARLSKISAPSARQTGFLDIRVRCKYPVGVSNEIFGTPVPREAYDLSFNLSGADSVGLINSMLEKIEERPNPFLKTADELSSSDFPGVPYRYSP